MRVRVGIGGWNFAPWRGVFYPKGLGQHRELDYASRRLTSIEINATYYRSQTAETFAKWHDETPDGFIFAVKAPRFATNRRVLAEAGASIERFLASGVTALRSKLGPINWQFMPTKVFDRDDFARFLTLLPKSADGLTLRHAVEVRHDSFKTADFVSLARDHGVAVVVAGDSGYPQIADLTAPFVYARIMGTNEAEPNRYDDQALDLWAMRARMWASGKPPADLETFSDRAADQALRPVFLYVISGAKQRNPAAAMALIGRVGALDG